MERMLVVVFENELKAYDGSKALSELDAEGSISIHAKAVIMKNAEEKVVVKQKGDEFPVRTVGGTAIGALIGLLGGPIGVGIGAIAGTLTGSVLDLDRAGVDTDFVDDVSKKLTPGKWAIVADVSEEWETPVDTRMATLGGTVFRSSRRSVEDEQYERDVAATKAHIAQLKEEETKARADQKAKIQSKINTLDKNLNSKINQAKERTKQQQKETKAKIDALEKKASAANAEAKAKIKKRIAEIEKNFNESKENWDWLHEEPVSS